MDLLALEVILFIWLAMALNSKIGVLFLFIEQGP